SPYYNLIDHYELSVDQLVRFLVVEPTLPGSSPRLGTGDVPVDNEAPVVISLISRCRSNPVLR
ncbi:hypothetical protein U9M48_003418, partial [Paspalum notatum var. saurae]